MLTRRPTSRSLASWRGPLERWFDESMLDRFFSPEGGMSPSVDMRETDSEFIVQAEMPGVRPEDTEVTLDGRTLLVRGRYSDEREREASGGSYLIRERHSGALARTITLPGEVDPEQVSCTFENGELTVRLPKSAQSRSRRIPISSKSGPGTSAEHDGPDDGAGTGDAPDASRGS